MRASDQRRERTVAELRERALDGCLTLDTFADRVGAAYRARTSEELEGLVADLPRDWRVRARRAFSALFSRPAAGQQPALEMEVLLPRERSAVTVGRGAECDVVVGEATVSRRHAELRHSPDDTWTVRDLGSLNGTWVNGSPVREARVRRGDELWLGGLRMELRL
jgi:FHA domain-containing protein/uncharacterized protein DUF1707